VVGLDAEKLEIPIDELTSIVVDEEDEGLKEAIELLEDRASKEVDTIEDDMPDAESGRVGVAVELTEGLGAGVLDGIISNELDINCDVGDGAKLEALEGTEEIMLEELEDTEPTALENTEVALEELEDADSYALEDADSIALEDAEEITHQRSSRTQTRLCLKI
jgi:hypothetical protein